jgi:molecular chaperone DnaK
VDNKTLGKFQLSGLQGAPRGVTKIEVTFDIDQNGIVHVSARDTATGITQNITITASSGLASEEVERMVREAEQYRKSDERRREEQEVRNKADQQIYQAMRMGRDAHGIVEEKLIQTVNASAANLTASLNNFDAEMARKGLDALTADLLLLSKAFYDAKAGGNGARPSAPSAPPPSSSAAPPPAAPQAPRASLAATVESLKPTKSKKAGSSSDVDAELHKLAEILEKQSTTSEGEFKDV